MTESAPLQPARSPQPAVVASINEKNKAINRADGKTVVLHLLLFVVRTLLDRRAQLAH